jgi:hypothetical protein
MTRVFVYGRKIEMVHIIRFLQLLIEVNFIHLFYSNLYELDSSKVHNASLADFPLTRIFSVQLVAKELS